LTVSRLYHYGGTLAPLWIVVLFLAVLPLTAAHGRARGGWRLLAGLARGAAAGAGLLVAGWLMAVELVVFRARCPFCLIASTALATAFALAGFRAPRGRTVAAAVALAALAIGYLLPFGTIPRVAAFSAPAPELDVNSALRSRGEGPLLAQVFGDFECPACAQMDRSLERFLDQHEGQVQRVYRHFPLAAIHPWAERAAIASECAARQGRFEDAKRTLFERQAELGSVLAQHPEESWHLPNLGAFRACVEERQTEGAVREDVATARRLGLRSTPSLLVGRTLVVGTVPLSRWSTILEFARRQGPSPAGPTTKAQTSGCGDDLSGGGCSVQ
jgi:protein-disulfide isomerase